MGTGLSPLAHAYRLLALYCWYCGRENDGTFIIEHQVPRRRGGTDDASNLVVACRSCNSLKSYRTVDEWRAVLSDRTGLDLPEVVFLGRLTTTGNGKRASLRSYVTIRSKRALSLIACLIHNARYFYKR